MRDFPAWNTAAFQLLGILQSSLGWLCFPQKTKISIECVNKQSGRNYFMVLFRLKNDRINGF